MNISEAIQALNIKIVERDGLHYCDLSIKHIGSNRDYKVAVYAEGLAIGQTRKESADSMGISIATAKRYEKVIIDWARSKTE